MVARCGALAGFVASFAIAVALGFGLAAGGYTRAPLLVTIVLCATSLDLVVPVLKDAGQIAGDTGRLIVAAQEAPQAFTETVIEVDGSAS